ncbi:hypothetical protein BCR37DRAFT_20462 [Protomyces lactucae-debilis]|uniref:PA domain-containing protein n=1 Tax=Protomyces lactucae-debilis TaxID=2754530 RepID=A0A1Y2FXV5_PROLT|nr:uncharacterized protein BCR37DRAFT_20462 [Protomyces lactucae-debilis]ORY87996.1 hypothetical protein BCR37DRAFT_20462 [Protomyces lactucae-debilis]
MLGTLVLAGVFFFGGSMPRLKVPKRYEEGSLREYIKKQVSAERIAEYASKMEPMQGASPFVAEPEALAKWIQSELATFKMGRTALADQYVLQATGKQSWTFNEQVKTIPAEALVAHGHTGSAEGPCIFVGTARPDDFQLLASQYIQLEGSIALLQRNRSEILAIQLARTAKAGVSGILVYDARHTGDDALNVSISPATAEGGDAALPWVQPGDPLTPGQAADKQSKVLEREQAPGLLNLPVFSISADEAETLHEAIRSQGLDVSSSWPSIRATGPLWTGNITSPPVQLNSQLVQQPKEPLYSALSEIDGSESEQTLIVGTSMRIANAAVLLEVARVFASLSAEHSWMPRRNLVFAFWAGSEINFLGSTEWVEAQTKSLRFTGVAYLNLDHVMSNTGEFDIAAHTSLHEGISTALNHLDGSKTSIKEPEMFTDAIAFSARAGIPSIELGYNDMHISQACRSSRECIERVDPGSLNQARLAKLVALLVLEFVDEYFLPVDVRQVVTSVENAAQRLAHATDLTVDRDLAKVFQILEERTTAFTQFKKDWDLALIELNLPESPAAAVGRSNWNYAVVAFQRALIRNARWTVWFENSLYGPSAKLERQGESWALPRVQDALYDGDIAKAQGLLQMVGELLLEAAKTLDG